MNGVKMGNNKEVEQTDGSKYWESRSAVIGRRYQIRTPEIGGWFDTINDLNILSYFIRNSVQLLYFTTTIIMDFVIARTQVKPSVRFT